jgi:NAD(P)-dependent dehydrogenase (short-subunit alcohol dehydrogenase family)
MGLLDLRWRTVVVTGAASGPGREVALRFGRVGAAVVAVDLDGEGAAETARQVRACRVQAWSVPADLDDDLDLALLAGRLRDLGGADVLVCAPGCGLVEAFLAGLVDRRGRRDPGVVVLVGADAPAEVARLAGSDLAAAARITGVVPAGTAYAAAVLDLAARGADGQVTTVG